MISEIEQTKILISCLTAGVLSTQQSELIATLTIWSDAVNIAQTFGNSRLVRQMRLAQREPVGSRTLTLDVEGNQVLCQGEAIGRFQILFKSPLPGELQARLAIESAIDRFLEYLQKLHQIVVLDESDRHVRVFIPANIAVDFRQFWQDFLKNVAFSAYGNTQHQLPGLVQTFITMLNSITLAGRGFSTLDVPILTREQANVLAAWYLAVIRDVQKRQTDRQKQIEVQIKDLASSELSDKDRKSKEKDLQQKQTMQDKEDKKYTEYFQKTFGKLLEEHNLIWQELEQTQRELEQTNLTKSQRQKLQKQQEKLTAQIIFSRDWVLQKSRLFAQTGDPFDFIGLDRRENPEIFNNIEALSERFLKKATEQINSTRGDIFTQCIIEMYRLLENQKMEVLPEPLLNDRSVLPEMRSPGDDSKEFCYSCGVDLDPKTARWQVLRFMFERPSQRRQSSSSEGRPHICASCSALAFASPLKVSDDSVIIKLDFNQEKTNNFESRQQNLKDYIRMLANKEMHLSAGRYLVLASERTASGDLASQKLGQRQYALAKVALIFPREVLNDYKISLIIQGSPIFLASRHLIFINGLIKGYGQFIIISGKDINLTLGEAVRYVEQDLPIMAEYTLAKVAEFSSGFELEQTREAYWQTIQQDNQGVYMGSENQLSKRATLYKDVAALTGLTYAFVYSLEDTARKAKGQEYAEREVSKLVEEVDNALTFCYYATLGAETKTRVQARLYRHADNSFIYEQTVNLLKTLEISGREGVDKDKQQTWIQLYADDIVKAYAHFAENGYAQEKDWKELTYHLKLSLYTRFPELVRKLKSTSEKK